MAQVGLQFRSLRHLRSYSRRGCRTSMAHHDISNICPLRSTPASGAVTVRCTAYDRDRPGPRAKAQSAGAILPVRRRASSRLRQNPSLRRYKSFEASLRLGHREIIYWQKTPAQGQHQPLEHYHEAVAWQRKESARRPIVRSTALLSPPHDQPSWLQPACGDETASPDASRKPPSPQTRHRIPIAPCRRMCRKGERTPWSSLTPVQRKRGRGNPSPCP